MKDAYDIVDVPRHPCRMCRDAEGHWRPAYGDAVAGRYCDSCWTAYVTAWDDAERQNARDAAEARP